MLLLAAVPCLLLSLTAIVSSTVETNCEEKEKSLISLEVAEDLLTKAKDLLPHCNDLAANASECGIKEKVSAHLDMAKRFITEAKENYPTCIKPKEPEPKETPKSRDCSDVLQTGRNVSGVYTIWPSSPNTSMEVFCDMTTDGGGWTVVQRRGNFTPQENFFRDWNDYKTGFGNITKDFWIGNEKLFILSNQRKYRIRFELESAGGEKAHAQYEVFLIENEESKYKLHIENYTGNAGDSMKRHKSHSFATKDRDTLYNCAEKRKGGWWYENCADSNLNALYKPGMKGGDMDYVSWYDWKKYFVGLASTEMKIKAIVAN